MSIAKQVEQTLDQEYEVLSNDPEFIKLAEFYKKMQTAGVAKKQSFSILPYDSIGQRTFQATVDRSTK